MKKPLVLALVVFPLVAVSGVCAADIITYDPFQPDPGGQPWSRGVHVGPLSQPYDTMDVVPGGIPLTGLSNCSITVEGPPTRNFYHRIPLQYLPAKPKMPERVCGYDYTVDGDFMVTGSEQIIMCVTNPSPPNPPRISIRYSFDDYCS